MKKTNFVSFFTGMLATALIFGCITTALAVSNTISFNGVNLSVDGEAIFSKEEFLETDAGQKIPSSILYTDALGGGTTYLPVAYLSKLLGVPVSWNAETDTVVLGNDQITVTPFEEFLLQLAEQWLIDGEYPKNSKGETYGPDALSALVGYQPDLIAATATNGADGYIRRTDMEQYENLLIENSSEIKASGKPYTIPVYDLEGGVIGEFEFEFGNEEQLPME